MTGSSTGNHSVVRFRPEDSIIPLRPEDSVVHFPPLGSYKKQQPRQEKKSRPFIGGVIGFFVFLIVFLYLVSGGRQTAGTEPTYDQKVTIMKNDGWRAKGFILSKEAVYREEINSDARIRWLVSKPYYFRNGAAAKEALMNEGEFAAAGISPPPFVLEFRAIKDGTRLCLFFK